MAKQPLHDWLSEEDFRICFGGSFERVSQQTVVHEFTNKREFEYLIIPAGLSNQEAIKKASLETENPDYVAYKRINK